MFSISCSFGNLELHFVTLKMPCYPDHRVSTKHPQSYCSFCPCSCWKMASHNRKRLYSCWRRHTVLKRELSLLPSPSLSCLPLSPSLCTYLPQLAFSSLPFSFVIFSPPHPFNYVYILQLHELYWKQPLHISQNLLQIT